MFSYKARHIFTISSAKNTNSNKIKIPKQSREERLMRDLKPILQVARIFGLAPYRISNTNLKLSKTGLLYSAICLIFTNYLLCEQVYINMIGSLELKIRIIFATVVIAGSLCTTIDILVCIFWDKNLQDFLNRIKSYDLSMKCGNWTKSLVKWSWTMLIGLLLFIIPISVVTYYCLKVRPLRSAVAYSVFRILLSLRVLKFLLFAKVISTRCRDLNLTLTKDLSPVMDTESGYRKLQLEDAWQHHESLTIAAKNLNSIYSVQYLVWFSILSMSTMYHIYELSTEPPDSLFENIQAALAALFYIFILTLVAVVCHMTANEEILIFGQYFKFRTFYFSACGLFNINLPLLLTITSCMTTYLVILISPNHC